MKLAPLLLAASLVANAVLLAVLVQQPASKPAAASSASQRARAAPHADPAGDALRAALASGDAAALERAGLAPDVARQIVLGRALSRFAERMRGAQSTDGKWWRNRGLAGGAREEIVAARREIAEALLAAFGDDFGLGGGDGASLAFLSAEKRAALRRVTQDYAEMEAKFSATGIQLPSDRERLKLLRAERDRDIAALLTPAEFAEYDLRTSPAAASVRARYGDAIDNEDEFRRLVALQKAFDERFPRESFQGRVPPELLQQRSAAERQLQEDIRAAVGEQRYAELRRASDSDLRNVDALAQRLNLPAGAGDRVAALRETYAAQSQRISSDATLTPQQRRDQIQALWSGARAEVASTLGAEAGEAYAQRSPWLSMLQGGVAYSTNPKDAPAGGFGGLGQSVFPVMPPGAIAGSPARQVVNIVNTIGNAPGDAGGPFFTPATGARTVENVQVISVGPAERTTTAPAQSPAAGAPAPSPRP